MIYRISLMPLVMPDRQVVSKTSAGCTNFVQSSSKRDGDADAMALITPVGEFGAVDVRGGFRHSRQIAKLGFDGLSIFI